MKLETNLTQVRLIMSKYPRSKSALEELFPKLLAHEKMTKRKAYGNGNGNGNNNGHSGWVGTTELCRILKTNKSTLYIWRRHYGMPYTRLGKNMIRFNLDAVNYWMSQYHNRMEEKHGYEELEIPQTVGSQ